MKKILFVALFVPLFFLSAGINTVYAEYMSGELNDVKGTVEYLQSGDTEWDAAVNGLSIGPNDRIRTKPRSSCDIELDDGSMIHIGANSETSVEKLELREEEHTSSFKLLFGKVIASISKLKKTKMDIRTPTSICAVRGTEFAVDATESDTNVGVFEGQVAVVNPETAEAQEVMLNPDEETSIEKGLNPKVPEKLREAMIRNRERMSELRGRVKALKQRLKRVPPAERLKARQLARERFQKLRSERRNLKEKLHNRRENIKQRRQPR